MILFYTAIALFFVVFFVILFHIISSSKKHKKPTSTEYLKNKYEQELKNPKYCIMFVTENGKTHYSNVFNPLICNTTEVVLSSKHQAVDHLKYSFDRGFMYSNDDYYYPLSSIKYATVASIHENK